MKPSPPKYALNFLRWFCREDYLEELEGDLIEVFEMQWETSPGRARRNFNYQVIRHLHPEFIKPITSENNLINRAMFQNHFKVAWRHIFNKKLYSFINISGLGVGMACCMLIIMYVKHELSYDKYHQNLDNIYRVLHAYKSFEEKGKPTSPEEFQVWGCAPAGPALLNDFPEVKSYFRFTSPSNMLFEYEDKRFQEDNMVFADSNAFDMFSWKFLAGDPQTALDEPFTIVLTEKIAQKYFGAEDPIGKLIKIEENEVLKVTGVMENVPANSHFTFEGLISMSTFKRFRPEIFDWWGYVDFYTYFTLNDNASIVSLKSKVPEFVEKYTGNWEDSGYDIAFEPMADAYLHSVAGRQPGETGSLQNLYIFSSIAVFILLIACINFINLSTSRSLERAKEVGIRKVVGAYRQTLMGQFLSEFILLALFAAVLAVLLVVLFSPILQDLTGKPISYQNLLEWETIVYLLSGIVIIGILAGIYPATLLVGFQPAKVLKGTFKSSGSGAALRKGLVIFQFSLSIALMVGTAVVFSQLQYLRNHDLGFDQEQMLIVDFGWDGRVQEQIETIKNTILDHPNVLSIAASRAVPGNFLPNAGTTIEGPDGEMVSYGPTIYEIDQDFIPNYKIEMAAGRAFSRDFPNDTAQSLILNEAAAKMWGYHNPEDMIGKRFDQWGKSGMVIGVVKNFNYQSLHNKVEPLSLRFEPYSMRKFSIRVKSENIPATLSDLEKTWAALVPHRPFIYSFLDETFNKQYKADVRFGQLFSVFAGIAILIACLGLFGLTAYTTSQRTKEIGVRKVLGASVGSIVTLLSAGFIKLFIIALLISIPVSWYVMNRWLEGFAYQVGVGVEIYFVAGFMALVIALLTISWQSLKAAFANPVKSLRSE
ncbi:ABC transporter permease [Flexithrix dorotheae]|uniref:ABC transporter permease n=1 Tax=Flexithrix dorotheae TaxID=70993 RepID=UPI0003740317|nr:ABC transporter permease [Flexithrix dorotheae]